MKGPDNARQDRRSTVGRPSSAPRRRKAARNRIPLDEEAELARWMRRRQLFFWIAASLLTAAFLAYWVF